LQLASFFWCIILEEVKNGAAAGIIIGFHLLLYTSSALCYWNNKSTSLFIQEGPWEITLLKPFQLFGLDYLKIPHAVFWSLLFNVMSYAAISVSFKGIIGNVIMPKCL
jgi:Na+/proline symporter